MKRMWNGGNRQADASIPCFQDSASTNMLLELYLKLLSIASPSGEEEDTVKFLIEYIKSNYRITGELDKIGNLRFQFPATRKHLSQIGLTAHMDTYLSRKEKMTPVVEKHRVVTRSSSILGGDNRTAIAGILAIMPYILPIPRGDLSLIFTVREECLKKPGCSYGADRMGKNWLRNLDLLVAMDVPSGGPIKKRNFLVYHMSDDDPILTLVRQAASESLQLRESRDIYLESENGGYIGGDATTFYRTHKRKVLDFGTGNFFEHTKREYTDLKIYTEQLNWMLSTLPLLLSRESSFFRHPLPH